MTNTPRILTLLCLLILTASYNWAQDSNATSKKRSSDKVAVKSKYDSLKNETAVLIDPVLKLDENNSNYWVALTAGFTYPGQSLRVSPKSVELGIVTVSPYKWQFDKVKDRELKFIVDGEQIIIGTLDRVDFRTVPFNSIFSDRTELYFEEKLAGVISYETFQKIANGKKVVMKIGRDDSKLNRQNLEVISELASKMEP